MLKFLVTIFLSLNCAFQVWGNERYEILKLILEDRKVLLEAVKQHHVEVEKELQQMMGEMQVIRQRKTSKEKSAEELEREENGLLFKLVNRTSYRERVRKKIYELRFEIEEISQILAAEAGK